MEDPVVDLENGLARGVIEKHEDGFEFYAFRGIPFAEPPIGELRFQDPVPKSNWKGVRDCKNFGGMCSQKDYYLQTLHYNEDCLYLNVYTRSINEQNEYNAVIIIIHGGSFLFGSGNNDYVGPEHLIRKNVVIVTTNYRLGVLGFLDLEDEVAPGNQGLKDQLMAIEWVQRNIRVFTGNPNNVTLMGIGAGGICAHYLALSPRAKGLFHKIIIHAGLIQEDYGKTISPKRNAMKFCMLLGKELVDSREILQFLKSVDIVELLAAQEQMRRTMLIIPFSPGADSSSANPILDTHPEIECKRAIQVPCMIGFNADEASILMMGLTTEEFFQICNKNIVVSLKYNGEYALTRYNVSHTELRQLYYNSEVISEKNVDKFIQFMTELHFVEPICTFLKVQAETGSAPTYVFKFTFKSEYSINDKLLQQPTKSAGHLDELPYIFKTRCLEKFGIDYYDKGSRDYKVMERMTEMWTNFAKYGKPTVEISDLIPVHWKPMSGFSFIRYLNIDEDIRMLSTVNFDVKLINANK